MTTDACKPETARDTAHPTTHPNQDAGQDKAMMKRLRRNPEDPDARLDVGLDESMDASDPPSSTQPVHNTGPAPSSGYDEAAEKRRAEDEGNTRR